MGSWPPILDEPSWANDAKAKAQAAQADSTAQADMVRQIRQQALQRLRALKGAPKLPTAPDELYPGRPVGDAIGGAEFQLAARRVAKRKAQQKGVA